MAGVACWRATPGLYGQTHVAENADEVRWVAGCSPRRAATSTSMRATACSANAIGAGARHLARRRRPRAAGRHGAAIAFCPRQPVPGQRPLRLGGGRRRRPQRDPGHRRGRRHQPDRYRAHGRGKVQGADAGARFGLGPLHAATRGAAGRCTWATRSAASASACADLVGTGTVGARRWKPAAIQVAGTLHDAVFAWLTLAT